MNILDIKIEVITPCTTLPLFSPVETPNKKLSYYVYIDNFEEFNIELMKLIQKHKPKNI